MVAYFLRKACNLKQLKDNVGKGKGSNYVIEKAVELEAKEYENFSKNLLEDQSFFEEHVNRMRVDADNVWHSILVKARSGNDGILVETEGYNYARYAAYYPAG